MRRHVKRLESPQFLKIMPGKKQAASRALLATHFLLDFRIKPEDGGSTFLQIGGLLLDHMALHPRKWCFS
jgi:hypothetical protein